ncbi:hypothetical protein LINPERPRIM_LOCUS18465 [Linum perenne]
MLAQVAGVVVVFEVQRSAKSEARKEAARKQELEEMRQRDDDLAREVDNLRQKLNEIEQLARGQGLTGLVHLKPSSKDPQRTMKPV